MLSKFFFLLIDIWIFIRNVWFYITLKKGNYHIVNIDVKYDLENTEKPVYSGIFWLKESKKWSDEGEYFSNADYLEDIDSPPQNVKNIIVFITYLYENQPYVFCADDVKKEIPRESKTMRFSIPVQRVYAIDKNDMLIEDITSKYISYSGPKKNFHEQDIPSNLIFDYDAIKVENVMGETILINTKETSTKDLP